MTADYICCNQPVGKPAGQSVKLHIYTNKQVVVIRDAPTNSYNRLGYKYIILYAYALCILDTVYTHTSVTQSPASNFSKLCSISVWNVRAKKFIHHQQQKVLIKQIRISIYLRHICTPSSLKLMFIITCDCYVFINIIRKTHLLILYLNSWQWWLHK